MGMNHSDRCHKYFHASSELGYIPAQYELGYYYHIRCCNEDWRDKEALRYFNLAAEQGHEEAVYMLGY